MGNDRLRRGRWGATLPRPERLRQRLGQSEGLGLGVCPPISYLVWNKQLKSTVRPSRCLQRGKSNEAYFIKWVMSSLTVDAPVAPSPRQCCGDREDGSLAPRAEPWRAISSSAGGRSAKMQPRSVCGRQGGRGERRTLGQNTGSAEASWKD